MKTLDKLQQIVAQVPQATIHEVAPGYPFIRITNAFGSAEIAMHGAHLTSFTPRDASEVIFVSRDAVFKAGMAIRGGIPICWPWFSRHQQQPDLPSHGIARTSFWDLQEVHHSDSHTQVVMSLSTDGDDPRWPYVSSAIICFTIGASLDVSLSTRNADKEPFQFGDALHCYFQLSEAERTEILGLDGSTYVYRLEDTTPKAQVEPIIIDQAIDRIFESTGSCSVVDRVGDRIIVVRKSGSSNTVVWNPGAQGATEIADLADEEYSQFVCVEPANTHPVPITLMPGASHTTQMSITLEQHPSETLSS